MSPATAQTLLEFAPDALVLIDGLGIIVHANGAVSDILGYEPEALVGQSLTTLVPERLRERHGDHVLQFAKAPARRTMSHRSVSLFARRRDGTEFPAAISLAPIRVDGQWHVLAAIRDVSDAHRIAEDLRHARDEADKANRAKSLFIAAASHDLRQPLQALQLLNATLRRRGADIASADLIEQQQQAINSMADMLNAVLDIGRLESGTLEPHIEDVAVARVFAELRVQFEPIAAAKGLALRVQPAEGLVRTDRVLLVRMVQNLLGNAVKYTASGHVSLRSWHTAECFQIEVADTGGGIPADRLGSVFQAYYQLDPGQRGQGLGLGLAIVKQIANRLSYGLDVQSEVGRGTQFRISIPGENVVRRLGRGVPAQAAEKRPGALRQRILVIEDDPFVGEAILLYLRLEGFEATATSSATEADEHLCRTPYAFELVITDYHLGAEKSGADIIEAWRARAGLQLPVIFLSGDTSLATRSLQGLPRTTVLNKPVDAQHLVRAITQLLQSG